MTKILSIVGARPQFIKLAPLQDELSKQHESIILHTGQHYDTEMSQLLFDQLHIPSPDYNLGIGSGSQGTQTGKMLEGIESALLKEEPDIVIVFGDTNSTIAGSLAATKLHIPVVHVEAGLRSFNRRMPEEINRVLTDHCSDILFAPTVSAVTNLEKEGITENVHNVGDIMYDAIIRNLPIAKATSTILDNLGLSQGSYDVLTIHRQENTDERNNLVNIIETLVKSEEKIIFPVHPRTIKYLHEYGLSDKVRDSFIKMIRPLGYLDFLHLVANANKILTDSGGVQKEAYLLEKPCITLRNETEWVETVEDGWNILVGSNQEHIISAMEHFCPSGQTKNHYGYGDSAKKIVTVIDNYLTKS